MKLNEAYYFRMNIIPFFCPAFTMVASLLTHSPHSEKPCNSPTKENVAKQQVRLSQHWTESKGPSACKSA